MRNAIPDWLSKLSLLSSCKLCVARKKNSTICINMYRARHGCWQHIFDSPAAIIHNLLARIPNSDQMPAAIRSSTYKSRSKDVFGFMGVLIFARRKEPVSLRHLFRWRYFDRVPAICETRQENMIVAIKTFSDRRKCANKITGIWKTAEFQED